MDITCFFIIMRKPGNFHKKMLKLHYDGNDNISNEDGVIILKRARLELVRRLSITDNNARVLLIFECKEILDSLESAALRSKLKRYTSSHWTFEFCKLLESRADIGAALNLLLSLDDDSELKNYRAIIRQTFDTLELPKRLEVIDIAPCPDGRQELSEVKEEESSLLPINPSTPERYSSIEISSNPTFLQNLGGNVEENGEKLPVSHSHLDDIVSANDFKSPRHSLLKNFLKKPTKQLKPLVFVVKITTAFILILVCAKLLSIYSTPNDISSKTTTAKISFTTEDTTLPPFETTSQKAVGRPLGEPVTTRTPNNQRSSSRATAFIDRNITIGSGILFTTETPPSASISPKRRIKPAFGMAINGMTAMIGI